MRRIVKLTHNSQKIMIVFLLESNSSYGKIVCKETFNLFICNPKNLVYFTQAFIMVTEDFIISLRVAITNFSTRLTGLKRVSHTFNAF